MGNISRIPSELQVIVDHVVAKRRRGTLKRILETEEDAQGVMNSYRKIQSLLQRLGVRLSYTSYSMRPSTTHTDEYEQDYVAGSR